MIMNDAEHMKQIVLDAQIRYQAKIRPHAQEVYSQLLIQIREKASDRLDSFVFHYSRSPFNINFETAKMVIHLLLEGGFIVMPFYDAFTISWK